MPIKRITTEPAAAAAPKIKRVTAADTSSGEYVTKEQLLDQLVIVTLRDYDATYLGNYGSTEKADVDVVFVETGERHEQFRAFGNLARQLGAGLDAGEIGLGRVRSGPTKDGRGVWFGFEFSEDDGEHKAAEAILDVPQF